MSAYMTDRRDFLEAMVEKYRDNFEKGQDKEDIISSIAALTYMREKTMERDTSLKKEAHFFPDTGLFAKQIKEDLTELDAVISISYRKTEPVTQDLDIKNPNIVEKALFMLDKFVKDTKTAFEIADNPSGYDTPNKLSLSLFKRAFNNIEKALEDAKILDGSKREGIEEARREFAARSVKESITNLAINTSVHAAYYNDEYDKKVVFDVIKNLRDKDALPAEAESVCRKYNPISMEYEFKDDPQSHTAYTVLKSYDKLVEHINSQNDSNILDDSQTLMQKKFKEMMDSFSEQGATKNLSKLSPDEMKMDIYTYALTKSSVVLAHVNQTLNDIQDVVNKHEDRLVSDYSVVMSSLDDTRAKVVEALGKNIGDMTNVAQSKKLEESLLAIMATKENNYDLFVNSLMDGKLFESAKDIEISSGNKMQLDILRDRYSDIIEDIQIEAASPFINSSLNFKKFFYEKLPKHIEDMKTIESETNEIIKLIIKDSSLTQQDIKKDRFLSGIALTN